MPTDNWLQQNPKISAYIPHELHEKLQAFMDHRGISKTSEALKTILGDYLGHGVNHSGQPSGQLVDNSVVNQLSTVERKIDRLSEQIRGQTEQLISRQSEPPVVYSKATSSPLVDNLVIHSNLLPISEDWLTTGEAYSEAKRRGYGKAIGTFRRTLKDGKVPDELGKLGLAADFDIRSQANPKDNSIRWLRFKQRK